MAVNDLSIINEASTDDETKKHLIKYSLLHLSSGIELVLKHRLLQEHWTYVFTDMNKAKKKRYNRVISKVPIARPSSKD